MSTSIISLSHPSRFSSTQSGSPSHLHTLPQVQSLVMLPKYKVLPKKGDAAWEVLCSSAVFNSAAVIVHHGCAGEMLTRSLRCYRYPWSSPKPWFDVSGSQALRLPSTWCLQNFFWQGEFTRSVFFTTVQYLNYFKTQLKFRQAGAQAFKKYKPGQSPRKPTS